MALLQESARQISSLTLGWRALAALGGQFEGTRLCQQILLSATLRRLQSLLGIGKIIRRQTTLTPILDGKREVHHLRLRGGIAIFLAVFICNSSIIVGTPRPLHMALALFSMKPTGKTISGTDPWAGSHASEAQLVQASAPGSGPVRVPLGEVVGWWCGVKNGQ